VAERGKEMTFDTVPLLMATKFLRDLLSEFPFSDDGGRSLSVQVAAMVSRFAFTLLPKSAQIPYFCWNANSSRSGKSLLIKIVEIPVAGYCKMQTLPEEKDEVAKVLDSAVLSGYPSLIFDNVKHKIEGSALEQFATSSVHAGRRLGGNKGFEIRKQMVVLFSSNQAEISPDVAGRMLFVDLFNLEADPQAREIKKPIGDEYLERPEVRQSILSALWSLVHAWDAAGRPVVSGRLVGFEDWSRVIGGIVEHAGFGSPLRRPEKDDFGDPEGIDMKMLVEKLAAGYFRDAIEFKCREGISFNDLIWICRNEHLFEEGIAGKLDKDTREFEIYAKSRSHMGKLFAAYNGRVFRFDSALGSVKFERVGNRNARLYKVV
jgi:hypothetical protein